MLALTIGPHALFGQYSDQLSVIDQRPHPTDLLADLTMGGGIVRNVTDAIVV